MTPQGIVIINPFGIGDVLFTTPLVRAVRQAFPAARIGYVCNRRTEEILRHNPHLDRLFVYERDELLDAWRRSAGGAVSQIWRLLISLRRERFDLAIDLSLGERYSFALWCVGVRRRIGFDYRGRGRWLTHGVPIAGYDERHVVEHYRRLLRCFGVVLNGDGLELEVSEGDAKWAQGQWRRLGVDGAQRVVGLVPAGGVSWGIHGPFRRWAAEGFAAVADALVERYGAAVVLFGEAADQGVCDTVRRHMRNEAVDLSGQTSLGQFVALLGRLHLVVCNDGGPLHLAVSQGVKTVSVFGPVDPSVYGPYATEPGQHRVVYQEALPCRPCYHHFRLPPCPYERACLTTVEAEDVIKACDELLAIPAGPYRAGREVAGASG